jgi:hypothetical protein
VRSELTEQAAIDLALTVFKIKTVVGAVQVSHFAFFNTASAQSLGELLDWGKHCLASSWFHFFDDQKIGVAKVNYHRFKASAVMRMMHVSIISLSEMIIKRSQIMQSIETAAIGRLNYS